jgi:hypothetical protein
MSENAGRIANSILLSVTHLVSFLCVAFHILAKLSLLKRSRYMNIRTSTMLFSMLLLSLYAGAVETVRFDIFLFGDKIGTMTATHESRADGVEFYTLESTSKAKILWIDKENFSRYEVTYKNGKLISCTHKELENKKLKRWTNVNWNGSQYMVDSYKGKRSFTESPDYCAVSMYFKGFKDVKRIFYEAEADYDAVEHPQPNVTEFKSSDGTRNVYYFENGRIKSMDFHISIAKVRMERVN